MLPYLAEEYFGLWISLIIISAILALIYFQLDERGKRYEFLIYLIVGCFFTGMFFLIFL